MGGTGVESSVGVLTQAGEKARAYDWEAAVSLFKQAYDDTFASHRISEKAEIGGMLANAYFRTAFQSAGRNEFEEKLRASLECCKETSSLYGRDGNNGMAKRWQARALYVRFWLAADADDRRLIVENCLEVSEEAIRSLSAQSDRQNLAWALKEFLDYLKEALQLSKDWQHLRRSFDKAMEIAKETVAEFERLGSDEGLIESLHHYLGLMCVRAERILAADELEALRHEIERASARIEDAGNKLGTRYAVALAKEALGDAVVSLTGDFQRGLELYREALLAAKVTGDVFLNGRLASGISEMTHWLVLTQEYSDDRRRLLENGLEFAHGALESLQVPLHTTQLTITHGSIGTLLTDLATTVEVDSALKKQHLEKAIQMARQGIQYESETWAWELVTHAQSKAEYFLATISDPPHRTLLLLDALSTRKKTVQVTDTLFPYSYDRGVMRNYLALIYKELAEEEKDLPRKTELLQASAREMRGCLMICNQRASNPQFLKPLSQYAEWYGDTLFQLFRLTEDLGYARQAVQEYRGAVAKLLQLGHSAPLAMLEWKIARTFDVLGEYREASQVFDQAAEHFNAAVEKIPASTAVFSDLAGYMTAWSLIERAKLAHDEEQFVTASDQYTRAMEALQKTRDWSPLAHFYLACCHLEKGEAASREENHEASVDYFNKAALLFDETPARMETWRKNEQTFTTSEEANYWSETGKGRARYCEGKRDLEQAVLLDRRGEQESTLSKYNSATLAFRAVLALQRGERDRGEVEALVSFAEALVTMKQAELEESPELYARAADAFTGTGQKHVGKKFGLQTLATAAICKALEAGTRFTLSHDVSLYSEIKRHLEIAASHYDKAGLKNGRDWTRATQKLFDALAFLDRANTQIDPLKKTQLYQLAEKHLEAATNLYRNAGFPSKRDEALRYLDRAREEKDLLITPLQALSKPPTAATSPNVVVSLAKDMAIGLERFEEAEVVGRLSLSQSETSLDSELLCHVEIANIGKTPATLISLEKLVPSGFELEKSRNPPTIQGSSVDMRGRILKHLHIHEVTLVLKPTGIGRFELSPRIVFATDKGTVKSVQVEPSQVRVTEADIFERLKPERRLAAIMFTDMVGYTILGQRNESLSLALVEGQRKLIRPILGKHNGREVKTMGDAFLVEFSSASDAANCAVEIQQALHESNLTLPMEKRIALRIGVHLGEVTYRKGDVYGNAVNVASRIEPLADPGGICISDQIYAELKDKFGLPLLSMGKRVLKNVQDPMEVYRIMLPWSASSENNALSNQTKTT